MITIKSDKDCCGCEACLNKCPQQCITMEKNQEGFLYPKIDSNKCINCHLCEKVCPILHPFEDRPPYKTLAIKNKNQQIRKNSASGGLFSILAESIIEKGGCVYGAAFTKDWTVRHICITQKEELSLLRGSKYLQSSIGLCYQDIESKLKQGVPILFTGTPCQISGLKHYLIKEYTNLYTAEIICHSTTSPQLWQTYLKFISKGEKITNVNFRHKRFGWKDYTILIKGDKKIFIKNLSTENFYMCCIFKGLLSRYSCYECPAKNGRSACDITMGDFWGIDTIDKKFYDPLGVSVALLRNPKIESLLNLSICENKEIRYEDVLKYNKAIEKSLLYPQERKNIYEEINRKGICILSKYTNFSFKSKLKKRIKLLLHLLWK